MRILQLIDSLEAGGAERMAVNYANALATTLEFSSLVATRKEGPLLGEIDSKVIYLFLNKKNISLHILLFFLFDPFYFYFYFIYFYFYYLVVNINGGIIHFNKNNEISK